MEHYRRLGFADEIRALGMPADFPTDVRALAAAFALSPSLLTLPGDSSLGNMAALALAPALPRAVSTRPATRRRLRWCPKAKSAV